MRNNIIIIHDYYINIAVYNIAVFNKQWLV